MSARASGDCSVESSECSVGLIAAEESTVETSECSAGLVSADDSTVGTEEQSLEFVAAGYCSAKGERDSVDVTAKASPGRGIKSLLLSYDSHGVGLPWTSNGPKEI
jgi:hypothetical protein